MQGTETAKAIEFRGPEGFYEKYLSGVGLDVGYRGYGGHDPVTPNSVGVDLDFPSYDGLNLPFPDESQDFVYASHVLEHVDGYPEDYIKEWHRVVKVGGHVIIAVPHQHLFEKKNTMPSQFDAEAHGHKRFYTPSKILSQLEAALVPNTYRVVSLRDCDQNYNYGISPTVMPETKSERYEIELVIKKRSKPEWDLV